MTSTIPYEGIRPGEIIGYRVWRLERNKLRAVTADYMWKRGANGPATDIATTGGFYALKELSDAMRMLMLGSPCAIGKIAMWGEVIEHEQGYRAEYATIVELMDICLDENDRKPRANRDRMTEAMWERYLVAWKKETDATMMKLRRSYGL